MTKSMGIGNAIAIDMCNAIVDKIDVGAGTAQLKIYDGTRPAGVDVAVTTQNILSEHNLSNPAAGNAVDINPGARATFNTINDDTSANNTGTATWFRIYDRNGTARIDGNVGTTAAFDLILDNVNINAGQVVSIIAGTVEVAEVSP